MKIMHWRLTDLMVELEKELACGFGPCHKVGYEKSNSTQANVGKVLAPAPTLHLYSQPFGVSIAAGDIQLRSQFSQSLRALFLGAKAEFLQ